VRGKRTGLQTAENIFSKMIKTILERSESCWKAKDKRNAGQKRSEFPERKSLVQAKNIQKEKKIDKRKI